MGKWTGATVRSRVHTTHAARKEINGKDKGLLLCTVVDFLQVKLQCFQSSSPCFMGWTELKNPCCDLSSDKKKH